MTHMEQGRGYVESCALILLSLILSIWVASAIAGAIKSVGTKLLPLGGA
jgi:hypothetical protein